jgi:hypothetical protein
LIAAGGGIFGASVALAASISIVPIASNSWNSVGIGDPVEAALADTAFVRRTGQQNGIEDTGPAFPALLVTSTLGGAGSSALRANSNTSVDVLVGSNVPGGEASPTGFTADGNPSLFVGDDGALNTNGQKNRATQVNRVAIDAHGAVRLCGKSATSNPKCTSQVFLYLEDGSGDLVARFGNGQTVVFASP